MAAPDNLRPTEPALLALARKKFGDLSRAEEELFRAAQEGRAASALTGNKEEDDPANAENWKADRVVRAKCIAWACTDPQASALLTYRGLDLRGIRIDGELDLNFAEIKFPFSAWKCVFVEDIILQDAQLRGFYLVSCQIKSLNAGRAIIDGPVLLRNTEAKGEVNLSGTKIGGDLECDGAQFLNAEDLALNADGAKIEGNVFLRNRFKAEGQVNLEGATIGGALQCDGGKFLNARGLALFAHVAKIEGGVYLRYFKAEGQVNLMGTKIGGNLECGGGNFSDPDAWALDASGAKIEGDVFLRYGFEADGEVNLSGATIGNLEIHDVIKADQMVLNLRLTQVKTFWDDENSWPKSENLFLDGFRYERLYEEAPFEAESRKKWLRLQSREKFLPQPYEQLAAVLRQMGHERDARLVMIEKNYERARSTPFLQQGWLWYNVFGRLIGYGYTPWRAFAMSVAMIVLGTFLFHFGSTHDLISPTSENAYVKEPNEQLIREANKRPEISEKYPVFNAFFYSLESFTPLLKLDQSANWTPNANHGAEISVCHLRLTSTGGLLRYYLYFHIAAGWLLTSLWVGAITGLVKT
jgi:hypothetical protein